MSDWKSGLLTALVGGIVTLAGATLTGNFSLEQAKVEQVSENREIDIKMIDVALSILSGEKGVKEDETRSDQAKLFAVRLLRQYSGYAGPIEGEDEIDWKQWALQKPLELNENILSRNRGDRSLTPINQSLYELTISILEKMDDQARREVEEACGINHDNRYSYNEVLCIRDYLQG